MSKPWWATLTSEENDKHLAAIKNNHVPAVQSLLKCGESPDGYNRALWEDSSHYSMQGHLQTLNFLSKSRSPLAERIQRERAPCCC
ncbi:hypothetical protein BDV30DRAFT_128232 [Aspergillus minisclerotigenes]|uniref:Ankyrin repeat-containing domain protein n=1 Tax=Aspergillus minisclerotigenes TaxID=656917 RepID=A0A5N6J2H6_9EURO|nr:hypothetical protein BDV30DRAFT_128232 [Aspergillus minisclerotigenes]